MTKIYDSVISTGTTQVPMPGGAGAFQSFDFTNDSPYKVGIAFGQDVGANNVDYVMLPNTELLDVPPVSNSAYTVNGLWNNGPIFLYITLPGGGTVMPDQAPASEFTIIGHPQGYKPGRTIPLNRFQTLGNASIPATVTTAQNINNTGNPSGTDIITAQVAGDSNNAVLMTNDGQLTLGDSAHNGQLTVNNGQATFSKAPIKLNDGTNTWDALDAAQNFGPSTATNLYTGGSGNEFGLWGKLSSGALPTLPAIGLMDAAVSGLFPALSIQPFSSTTDAIVNGTTAGTVGFWLMSTTPIILLAYFNGYKNNSGTRQQFIMSSLFPQFFTSGVNAFSSGAFFWIGGITNPSTSGTYFRNPSGGGVGTLVATNSYCTRTSTFQAGSTALIPAFSIGEVYNPFDRFELDANYTGNATGFFAIFGF